MIEISREDYRSPCEKWLVQPERGRERMGRLLGRVKVKDSRVAE